MIEFDVLITNEYIDKETINKRADNGWKFVVTVPAESVHPSASYSDKATIFSKYTPYDTSDELPDSPK